MGLDLNKRLRSWCSACCAYMGMTRRLALEIMAKPLELPYECPHSGSKCSVIGNISELVKHLEDDHNVRETRFHTQPHDGYEFIHNHNQSRSGDLQNPPGMFAVLNCYGQRFCYHFELFHFGTAPCYIVFLRFMGEDTEAKKFRYSFKVSKNGRDLTWQGVPSSIRDSHHKKFIIQQYLQHEYYALWEVIEFDDSYKSPPENIAKDKGLAGEVSTSTKKKERTVAITAEDMHKRKNDVKARTTLLVALFDEHQLKAIISHLEFIDVPIEQDDLNQKFLTSLAPEWLVYIIVWRNRDDLDTMSLDDVYNHLKVYEPEVQKRAGSNSQNMAFISSSNTCSRKSEVPTIQGVFTASAQVSTDSTDVAPASLSYDTVCAFIATQPNGSQIKYEDISHIDDDIEGIDIKWNLALLSMRADRSPKSQYRWKRESYKKDPKVEEPAPKAMIAINGIGWD
nr:hypothetical protein [Tanacetum cinerariifolium]